MVKVLEIFPKITSVILFNGPCNDFRCSHECRCTWTPDCPLLDRRLKGHAIDKSLLIILFKAVAKFPQLKISQIAIQGHWTRAPYKDNCDFQDDWHIPGSLNILAYFISNSFSHSVENNFNFKIGSIKNCHQDDFKTARQWIERRPRIQYDAFHDLTSEHLALTISTFQNLTHLDVLLEPDPDIPQGGWDGWDYDTYPAVKPRWGDVPKVLEALTSLTHLSLDLSIHRHVDQQLSYVNIHDDLDVLFDGLTFPKLKTLKLAHFRSTTAILSALLQRHSGIKHLSLIEVIEIVLPAHDHYRISVWRNLNPEAEQLIEDIRALPLERLHLTGIETFGSPYHLAGGENHDLHLSRILDYTLHGYGGNPVTMAGLEECLEMDEELWDSHAWDVWNVEYSKKERMELKRWKGYLSQWQYDAVKEARRDTEGTRQARRDAEDVRGIKEDEELALWEWSLLDQEGY